MKYRISKKQAQMLIDGKTLRSGRVKIYANEQVKEVLKLWIEKGCPFSIVAEFYGNGFEIKPEE